MSDKQSGRRINIEMGEACWHRRVKKDLKEMIARKARNNFKRETRKAAWSEK